MSNEENLNTPDAAEQEAAVAAEASGEPETPVEQAAETATEVTEAADEAPEATDEAPAAAENVEAKEQKPAAKKPAAKKGMSKLFKLVYYPVLAFVALIFMIFSLVDGVYGYDPRPNDDKYYAIVSTHINKLASDTRSAMSPSGIISAREYIVSTLKAGGFVEAAETKTDDEEEGEEIITDTAWAKSSGNAAPTVTLMTAVPTAELQSGLTEGSYLVGYSLTNIIAAIPSKTTRHNGVVLESERETAGAVIITVRYDTRPDTVGAADNAAFVATAMETLIKYVTDDVDFENDIIVVFTEELDNSIGSKVFFESFKGLSDGTHDAVTRARAGINLEAYGNAGTLAMTDVSGAGLDYVNAVARVSGSAFNSSILPSAMPENYLYDKAVAAFGDIPALQVAVVGGLEAVGSPYDTSKNISQAIIGQQSKFFKSYVERFAISSKTVTAEGRDLTYFPYFDWGTVAYTDVAAYVFGALLLALIAGAVTVLVLKKTFSVKKLFIALGVQALVIASTLVAMYGAYFLVTLMLTGFGAIPIHAITCVRYFNGGILIAAMLISLASAFGFTSLYKKLFKVTSSDSVRGTAMLFGIVGAIMSFAAPAYSYLTSWVGLLSVAILLVTTCFNGKFKDKFGFGFDRLFVYVIPVILCMPFMLSSITMLAQLQPAVLLPVIMMLFTAMLGTAVPYLDRTVTVFDKLAKKLPKRTQRVEHTVTERVEDRAKKGKFTERTVRRVDKEKVAVNYKNYFGVSLLAVLGIIIALCTGGVGASFGKTVTPLQTYEKAIYNDSLVYEVELGGSGANSQKIIVDDLIAYKYFRYAIEELEWDAVNNYYFKTVNTGYTTVIDNEPSITRDDAIYTVKAFDGAYSNITLTIPGASAITKITVENSIGGKRYEYEFNNVETITLRLPYGFGGGSFTLEFEGSKPATIKYEEHREVMADTASGDIALNNLDDWNAIVAHYNDTDVAEHLRGGIVLKRTFSL